MRALSATADSAPQGAPRGGGSQSRPTSEAEGTRTPRLPRRSRRKDPTAGQDQAATVASRPREQTPKREQLASAARSRASASHGAQQGRSAPPPPGQERGEAPRRARTPRPTKGWPSTRTLLVALRLVRRTTRGRQRASPASINNSWTLLHQNKYISLGVAPGRFFGFPVPQFGGTCLVHQIFRDWICPLMCACGFFRETRQSLHRDPTAMR